MMWKIAKKFKWLFYLTPLLGILSGEYLKYTLVTIYLIVLDRLLFSKPESVIGSKLLLPEKKLNFFNLRRK